MDVAHILRCGICGIDFTKNNSIRSVSSNNTGHYIVSPEGCFYYNSDSVSYSVSYYHSTVQSWHMTDFYMCSGCHYNTINGTLYYAFRVPSIRFAELQSKFQPNTYNYLFSWKSPMFEGRFGATHALEVAFVFRILEKLQLFHCM